MEPIKILLVDPYPVVRAGLRKMLDDEEKIKIVGEVSDSREVFAIVESLSPDIIIMDIGIPGVDGIETIHRLKERLNGTNIIVFTPRGRDCLAQAIEAGAAGYLQKDINSEELLRAIHAVYNGQSVLSPRLSRDLFSDFANLSKGNNHRSYLSKNELEMINLIASGTTNKEIAAQLFLSETTVKRRICNIFNKLSARDRAQAVSEAHKRGLM